MISRLSNPARTAIDSSQREAVLRGDRRIGTDHLLLGVLGDPEIATLLGIDVQTARTHARDLDRRALAAIGIEAPELDLETRPSKSRHLRLSSAARAVIPRALNLASARQTRQITSRDLLQALLELKLPDPAAVLLGDLGIDPAKAQEQ